MKTKQPYQTYYEKIRDTINSCTTKEQLQIATKLVHRYIDRFCVVFFQETSNRAYLLAELVDSKKI